MVNGFMIFKGGSVSPLLRFGFSAVTDDIDDMNDNNE